MLDDLWPLPKWKDKYPIDWCDMCHTAIITCPECKLGSCSGGGCDKCHDDYTEFLSKSVKTCVENYLTVEECNTYRKIISLKKFILEGLSNGQKEIDFKYLYETRKMSGNEEDLFRKELYKALDLQEHTCPCCNNRCDIGWIYFGDGTHECAQCNPKSEGWCEVCLKAVKCLGHTHGE